MVLGVLLALGLSVLGYQLAAMASFKAAERAVTVKGACRARRWRRIR